MLGVRTSRRVWYSVLAAVVQVAAIVQMAGLARAAPVGVPLPAISYPAIAGPAPRPDDRFGIVDAYQSPDAARASGARWERVSFWWNEIQPDNPTEHNPPLTITDQQLQGELNAGMTVVGLLGNPPAWATRNGSTPANLYLPVTDPRNYWASFVRLMVTTYAGRINQWIIWNEPDIPAGSPGSTWAGTVDEYYQLVKDAAQVAHSFDPSEKIIVAGTTYWVDVTHGSQLFIDRFAGVAAADPTAVINTFYFDAVDLHVYSKASDVLRIAHIYREALRSHGIDKPLWLSETNVAPYDDPATPRSPDLTHETMAEQADFIIEAFAYALAAGIQRMSVYRIADATNDPSGPWGLLRADGTPRPAFTAFQTAVACFSGASNVHLDEQPYLDTLTYDRGSSKVWLFWATGQAPVQGNASLVGNSVLTVNKADQSSPMALPTSGVEPQLVVPVPASTSHSDDGGPQNTRVGGDPSFLFQSGIGEGIPLASGAQYFPLTGHTVGHPFLPYFLDHGGAGTLGEPLDEVHDAAGGSQVQDFQQIKLRTHPVFAGSDYFIEAVPATASFAEGAAYAPLRPVPPPGPGSDALYFPITGHTVTLGFRQFFESHGGLANFGYPRTEAFQQQGRTVQWFQRAMFEYHPEYVGTPYAVELRLLGSELTAGRDFGRVAPPTPTPTPTATPAGSPVPTRTPTASATSSPSPTATPTPPPVVYFPQTGHTVSFAFLQFFNTQGGIDVFGYPISQEIQEPGADGKPVTVQYFQRARFEYHPELAGTPYEVELGLLGDQSLGLR